MQPAIHILRRHVALCVTDRVNHPKNRFGAHVLDFGADNRTDLL